MRIISNLNEDWIFHGPDGGTEPVSLPHTWNALDGQDGGDDYRRCTCTYVRRFQKPSYDHEEQAVYLEFCGVNASADVFVNGRHATHHDGGYSTFRASIDHLLSEMNELEVRVDNGVNDRVYPQKADFTFYGGIYRDVRLVIVNREHFDMDYFGGRGVRIRAVPKQIGGKTGADLSIRSWVRAKEGAVVEAFILDRDGQVAARGTGDHIKISMTEVRLWNGVSDPYMYRARMRLVRDGNILDEIEIPFGIRSCRIDPKKGFLLNGRPYPLRGVSRHQDRKGIGNALLPKHHEEDMELIREVGATAVRLAHYQHDQYFYDLCDRYGLCVWAEIPYISEHMPRGTDNTVSQMRELIVQNHHHPSIVTWGISNEITISTKDQKGMLKNHRLLNELCHRMDPDRFTTLACYAMCGPFHKSAHITDAVGWNLYLGWYVPGLFLNDVWLRMFHFLFPKRPIGFSEFGCEAMPNLHAAHPRRGDHTEEYQLRYHEYMLRCFRRHPYMWSQFVWNMFDFAADARDQGGEPGMNHKGLVTFDRQTKKDSFYLYKAFWSRSPFVHIAGRRRVNRHEAVTKIRVYTNLPEVTLYVNGKAVGTKKSDKIFVFSVALPRGKEAVIEARSGSCTDRIELKRTARPDRSYRLGREDKKSANWM